MTDERTATQDLEYYIILVDNVMEGLERINSNFVGKMPSNSIACHREVIANNIKARPSTHKKITLMQAPQSGERHQKMPRSGEQQE